MGRQYNYYISPDEELKFAKYIFDNGFTIIAPNVLVEGENIVLDWSMDTLEMYNSFDDYKKNIFLFNKTYIYRADWGELKATSQGRIDPFISPVIENCHCVLYENKRLSEGRFYLNTYYKDDMKSFDIIYKAYQKLIRAMKKNITYDKYEFEDGKKFFAPSSQAAVELIKNGYEIGF